MNPQPSSGTNLGTAGYPIVTGNLLAEVQASKSMSFTLQAELTNAMNGGESLTQLNADLAAMPTADQATEPGDVSLVSQVVAAVTAAQNPIGTAQPSGVYSLGPGFISWLNNPEEISYFDPSVPYEGYQLFWVKVS